MSVKNGVRNLGCLIYSCARNKAGICQYMYAMRQVGCNTDGKDCFAYIKRVEEESK